MTIQERFDDLENFLQTLRYLLDEVESDDLKEELNHLLYGTSYWDERDKLEEELAKYWDAELNERDREYRKMQGF